MMPKHVAVLVLLVAAAGGVHAWGLADGFAMAAKHMGGQPEEEAQGSSASEGAGDEHRQSDTESPQVQAFQRLQKRLSKALRPPEPHQTKTPASELDISTTHDSIAACTCSEDGKSGEAYTPYVGCGKHIKGFAAFCVVAQPADCVDFSKESGEFPGARWKLCTAPKPISINMMQAGAQQQDAAATPGGEMKKTVENGISKYSMQTSGISTSMVTEGDMPLEGDAGLNRTIALMKDVKQTHKDVKSSVNAKLNETKEAVDIAYSTVNDAMFGAMSAVNLALTDAFNGSLPSKPTQDQATFEAMYNRIEGRVQRNTMHLQTQDDDDILKPGTKETLYDRLLGMSDTMLDKMDRKMEVMSVKMEEKLNAASEVGDGSKGPITVSTDTGRQ